MTALLPLKKFEQTLAGLKETLIELYKLEVFEPALLVHPHSDKFYIKNGRYVEIKGTENREGFLYAFMWKQKGWRPSFG